MRFPAEEPREDESKLRVLVKESAPPLPSVKVSASVSPVKVTLPLFLTVTV